MSLTDDDLIARLKNFEDHFVERKTSGDSKDDWVKTAVAFANSAPIDFPCVLFIGVKDSGDLEDKQIDLDGLQKKFNKEMTAVYPRIPYIPKVLNVAGKQCLAVIILGSPARPHFAGPAYVRIGSETRNASERQFEEMIASRNSKASKILEFKGKEVTVLNRQVQPHTGGAIHQTAWTGSVFVIECNQFWVTLRCTSNDPEFSSHSLSRIELGFDHKRERLRLEIEV